MGLSLKSTTDNGLNFIYHLEFKMGDNKNDYFPVWNCHLTHVILHTSSKSDNCSSFKTEVRKLVMENLTIWNFNSLVGVQK